MKLSRAVWPIAMLSLASGCVLAPHGTEEERLKAELVGTAYAVPVVQRILPEVSDQPSWQELLRRALASNGEVEVAYFQWRAALAEIDVAAGYPNTDVMIGASYLFGGAGKGWDRGSLSLAPNSMQNLSLPQKVMAAGEVALANARVAETRLRSLRLVVQQRVLTAYFEMALLGERIRLQHELVALLEMAVTSARAKADTGASQQDAIQASLALAQEQNRLEVLQANLRQQRAQLNTMAARPADATLQPPSPLPLARSAPEDAELLATGVARSPDLEALAHAAAGGSTALELARLQFLPDINPFVTINGGMEQMVGAAVTLSTMLPQLRGRIAAAEAMLRATEAELAQAKRDRAGAFVATLLSLRSQERQEALLQQEILPLASLAAAAAQRSYEAGEGALAAVVESQRTLLEARGAVAEARMLREIRLAELESQAGVEVDSSAPPTAVANRNEEQQP